MPVGGRRPGAGRPRGSKNKAKKPEKLTLEALARQHTALALGVLVGIAKKGESEGARISAATALLDRGYGKPRQAVEHTGKDGGPIETEVIDPQQLARQVALLLSQADPGDAAVDQIAERVERDPNSIH